MLRMFGPRKEKLSKLWRKLHDEERHNAYSSINITNMIKSMRMISVEYAARAADMRNSTFKTYKTLVRKPQGKRPHCRHRHNVHTGV
jgi:hypothetical protein